MADADFTTELFGTCYREGVRHRETEVSITSPIAPFYTISNPWSVYDDFYNGEHYRLMPRMGTWRSRPFKNLPRILVDANTTFLTDSRPRIAVLPREGGDEHIAELCNAAVNYWQDKHDYDIKEHGAIKASRKYGLGWMALLHEGKEDVPYVIHPDCILVDPDCTMEDYDPTWLIFEQQVQFGELLAKYAGKIDEATFDAGWAPADASFWQRVQRKVKPNKTIKNPAQSVTVYQFWVKDTSRIMWEEDMGDFTVMKSKKKYPKGRVITIAGGQILEDKENPYNHGEFPFIPFFADLDPGRMNPQGDIQNILPQTVYRNRIMQLLIDSLVKAGGWVALVNRNAGLTAKMLTNDPVQVHEVKDVNAALKIHNFGGLSRHEFNLIGVLDKDADDVGGQHEMSRGSFEPGNKTAQEVAVIAESDKTRIRSCARLVAWSNKMLARQLLSNWAQWSDFEWMVRIAGEDDEMKVPFSGDMLKRTNDKGKLTEDVINFDIKVDDDSMLPASQRDKAGLYLQLADRYGPAFPVEDLFEALGVPKRIAAKIASAQQPPPAPQGPPPMDPTQMMPPQGPPMMGGPSAMGGEMPPEMMGGGMMGEMPMMGGGMMGGGEPSPEVIAIMQQTGVSQAEAEAALAQVGAQL